MLESVSAACLWVGALALTSLLCWVLVVCFHMMRTVQLLDRLPTRAVLITGCDSGFGHGVARRLDALGVPVFAGCLLPDGPGARSLAADCSSRLRVLALDVTSDQQVADAVAYVEKALTDAPGAELWAVLNNAGIADFGETDITPFEKFRQVLDVNALGPIRVSKAFLPLLKKSKGRLVNVASGLGRLPLATASTYCVSKSALIMFTDVLRMEMEKWSVTVSTVEPAMYGTNIVNAENLQRMYVENMGITLSDQKESSRHEAREDFQAILKGAQWLARTNISEVVDQMVAACIGRSVQRKYTTGFVVTTVVNIGSSLPDWLRESLTQLTFKIIKILWAQKRG